ncbi:MAG: hypothetical protein MUO40_05190 [Anaerolineaceae bacterium]|nr:hypothetical protein [Anaerolineaceae bacterium]
MFGFIFSDGILDILSSGPNERLAIYVAPLFVISILGFIFGTIAGYVAKYRIKQRGEEGIENARNAIRYGLFGLGFILISPLINLLLEKIGIQFVTYLDFFKGV